MTELDPQLESRLRAAAAPLPAGDWLDVRRRARRPRRRALLVLAAAVAMLLVAVPALGLDARLRDLLAIDRADEDVPAAAPDYVYGTRVVRGGVASGRLALPVLAPLLGQQQPLALPSPGGEQLLYHAWDGESGGAGAPVLRIHDLRSGHDRLLERGAQSAAWRRDGAIAYMQAAPPVYSPADQERGGGSNGQVVVRASPTAAPVRWTVERNRYVVLGWARRSLLVEVRGSSLYRTTLAPGVYAVDGPGRLRLLPIRELVAIGPDGRLALGVVRRGDGASTGLRLVDVAAGRVLASLPLRFVGASGDWAGRTAVTTVTGPESELVLLRISRRSLALEQRLRLGAEPSLRATYGPFLSQPVFLDGGRRIAARVAAVRVDRSSESYSFAGFLTCDRIARRCVRGRNLLPATTWAAIVDNPSWPEPAG